jgi:hypothetical protein
MSFKEKYQNFLEKINERIPIKKITAPLDKKNQLTSFFLFLIILIVIILLIINPLSKTTPEYNTTSIYLANNQEEILSNFSFSIRDVFTGEISDLTTDSSGKAEIDLLKSSFYELVVEQTGYERTIKEIDPSITRHNIILQIFDTHTDSTRQLTFVDVDGQEIEEELDIIITCENIEYSLSPNKEIAVGTLEFSVPVNCGSLVANVSSNNYSEINKIIPETQNVVPISYKQQPQEIGTLFLMTRSGDTYVSKPLKVMLFDSYDTITPKETKHTLGGTVRFENIEVGEYKIVVSDEEGKYVQTEKTINIDKGINNETIFIDALEGQGEDGSTTTTEQTRTIKVILRDQITGQEITSLDANPIITLIKDNNQTIDLKNYQEEGVSFSSLIVGQNYQVKATLTGYINKVVDVSSSEEIILRVEPITENNVANIQVKIEDEDDLVVRDALAWIYDEECKFMNVSYDRAISDNNGIATFEEIPTGEYCIKIIKSAISGQSESFTHSPPEDSNVTVDVVVGTATATLNVKNRYEDSVAQAQIDVYKENRSLVGSDLTTAQGDYSITLKADNYHYFKISKESFIDYYTASLPVVMNKNFNRQIKLIGSKSQELPDVEFVGAYDLQEVAVENFQQNQDYLLRFRIANYNNSENFGLKLSVGSETTVDEDIVYIKPIRSNYENVIYYSDFYNNTINAGEAKAIVANWNNQPNAVFEIDVPIKIKTALRGSAIPIFYSGYTQEIQTEPTQMLYYIETDQMCDDQFCIEGQYYDEINDLIYDVGPGPLSLITNNPYSLDYTITSVANIPYNEAKLEINNKDSSNNDAYFLDFIYYNYMLNNQIFTKGELQPETIGSGIPQHKIPFEDQMIFERINVFDKINATARLVSLLYGNTKLNHKIFAHQQVVYDNLLNIVGYQQPEEMKIIIDETTIVPNNPFLLTINVVDKEDQPLEEVSLNVIGISNNYKTIIKSGITTNQEGKATTIIPKLTNNQTLIVEASKSGYYATPFEHVVTEDILEILDAQTKITHENPLEINIHKNLLEGTTKNITLKNKTNYDIVIDQVSSKDISFINSYLINLDSTLGYINNQISDGLTIPAMSETTLAINLKPSQTAQNLFSSEIALGSIVFKGYFSHLSETTYAFDLPIKSLISVGKGVKYDNCLIIEQITDPWTAVVGPGSQVMQQFIIRNNCVSKEDENIPVALENIQAKIEHDGDKLGEFRLEIDNFRPVLSEGKFVTVVDGKIDPHPQTYMATLIYRAPAAVLSANLNTKIFINGQVVTDEGLSQVNTSNNPTFNAKIFVQNLNECIDFYDESKKINDMFVIEKDLFVGHTKNLTVKNNCSNHIKIRVNVLKEYEGFRGLRVHNLEGAHNDYIEFDVGESEKVIEVEKPTVPGAYTITTRIEARDISFNNVLATAEKRLRLNVKDVLYVDNPFIEVEKTEDESKFVSDIVELRNNNIEYSTEYYLKKLKDEGYSVSTNKAKVLELGNYNTPENTIKEKDSVWPAIWSGVGYGALSTGVVAATLSLISVSSTVMVSTYIGGTLAYSVAGPTIPLLIASGPIGWAVLGAVFIGTVAITPTFSTKIIENETNYYIVNDINYFKTHEPQNKTIVVNERNLDFAEYNNILLTPEFVYNITGDRQKSFEKIERIVYGKYKSNKNYTVQMPNCESRGLIDYLETNYFEFDKHKKSDKACGAFSFTEEDGKLIYSTKCSGSWPRSNRGFLANLYLSCRQPDNYWPRSIVAGMQPLIFEINNNDVHKIDQYQNMYNVFRLYAQDEINKNLTTPIHDGKIRLEFHREEIREIPDYNLEIIDCYTDSGKLGFTGNAANPNVIFNWDWKDFNNKPVDCTETYCDATQLSIDILTRIYKAQEILNSKDIICPKSINQMFDEQLEGTYIYTATQDGISQQVPVGHVGIESIDLFTESDTENIFGVTVSLENVTDSEKTVNLNFNLTEDQTQKTPTKVIEYDWVSNQDEPIENNLPVSLTTHTITIPAGQENTKALEFRFKDLLSNNLNLVVSIDENPSIHTNFSIFSTALEVYEHSGSNYQDGTNCEVPATSAIINGSDILDFWFSDVFETNTNDWTEEELQELKDLLRFEAFLITDKYTSSFIKAFDETYDGAYARKQPGFKQTNPFTFFSNNIYKEEFLSELFRTNFNFRKAYSNEETFNDVEIKTPGKYKVTIDLIFENDSWKFINNNNLETEAIVSFNKLMNPQQDSVFYRLPFNGPLGYTTQGYLRQGYGLAYLGDSIMLQPTNGSLNLETFIDAGSNPYKYLTISTENDFFKLNSEYETRGNILKINRTNQDNYYEMAFTPNTPKIIQLDVTRNLRNSFDVYYRLTEQGNSNNVIYGSPSLLPWSGYQGIDDNLDFSGGIITNVFDNRYDQITPSGIHAPTQTYHLSWPNVQRVGSVSLRTIMYNPLGKDYVLQSVRSSQEVNVDLYNIDTPSLSVESLQKIITGVENRNICVTNKPNGEGVEFWWNPKAIYETHYKEENNTQNN